jgi:hypothetical protein
MLRAIFLSDIASPNMLSRNAKELLFTRLRIFTVSRTA